MAIEVVTQGAEVNKIEHREGMKLSDALEQVGIEPDKKATITINNEKVKRGFFGNNDPILNDGDRVIITPKVSNG